MFLNNLYTLIRSEVSEALFVAEIQLDPGHHLFEGHFPGAPVLPGVVQLQVVKELLEVHFQKQLRMKQMRTCKFLHMINPQEIQDLRIEVKFIISEALEVTSSITGRDVVYLKAQTLYSFV